MSIIDEIVFLFDSDNITLFDNVLYDSEDDPQFSAVTTAKRIQLFLDYKKDPEIKTVTEYLLRSGYSTEDLKLFYKKYYREFPYYHGKKDNIHLE